MDLQYCLSKRLLDFCYILFSFKNKTLSSLVLYKLDPSTQTKTILFSAPQNTENILST